MTEAIMRQEARQGFLRAKQALRSGDRWSRGDAGPSNRPTPAPFVRASRRASIRSPASSAHPAPGARSALPASRAGTPSRTPAGGSRQAAADSAVGGQVEGVGLARWTVKQVQAPTKIRSPSASVWVSSASSGSSASLIQVPLELPLSRTIQAPPSA
jgi:hypothetical protein